MPYKRDSEQQKKFFENGAASGSSKGGWPNRSDRERIAGEEIHTKD